MVRRAEGGELLAALSEAKELGFLGPGPVEDHLHHAEAFLPLVEATAGSGTAADLGTGGGVPGLVLAAALPRWSWVFVEAMARRAAFLERAVESLDLLDRVTVRMERAERLGREAGLRGGMRVVTARSFGAPAVLAECASPLLVEGGILVVSEPPDGRADRWSHDGLAELGMALVDEVEGPPRLAVVRQARPCPERYPRRTGVPAKRPLW